MNSSTIPDIQLVDRQIAMAKELAIRTTGLDGISLAPDQSMVVFFRAVCSDLGMMVDNDDQPRV